MSLPVIAASDSGALMGTLIATDAGSIIDQVISEASRFVRSAQDAVTPTANGETAHMRRRLFRTLNHPERPMIAIDCGSVDVEQIQDTSDLFFTDPTFRENYNLVFAVPTAPSFAATTVSDWVESLKQRAFENGLDGHISWLQIEQADVELTALRSLVEQQGGQWYAA